MRSLIPQLMTADSRLSSRFTVDPCAPPAKRASRRRATTAGEIASRL
jgi:hypothetical protein